MLDLVFVSGNQNKLREISSKLDGKIQIKGLKELNIAQEIPETSDTIEGNASQKSFFIYDKYGFNCFADDTGLEIRSLNNQPGVYSARYAGLECDAQKNMDKVLQQMKEVKDRYAIFKTVISLIIDGKEKQFTGIVEGKITQEKKGDTGFGYDPIFKPKGHDRTFAQMSLEEKNTISHRALAVEQLVAYLGTL